MHAPSTAVPAAVVLRIAYWRDNRACSPLPLMPSAGPLGHPLLAGEAPGVGG